MATFRNDSYEEAVAFVGQVRQGDLVAGREVFSQYRGSLAHVCGNGSVMVKVRQRANPHRETQLYIKLYQSVSFEPGEQSRHNDLWAHLGDEHDHTPQDEHDAELDHDAMHRPGSVFGDPGHTHEPKEAK